MGYALVFLERYEEASKKFSKAAEISSYCHSYFNCGYALYHLKRYEEAIDQFRRDIQVVFFFNQAHLYWGLVLNDLQQYDQALLKLTQDQEVNSNNNDKEGKIEEEETEEEKMEEENSPLDSKLVEYYAYLYRNLTTIFIRAIELEGTQQDEFISRLIMLVGVNNNNGLAIRDMLVRFKGFIANLANSIEVKLVNEILASQLVNLRKSHILADSLQDTISPETISKAQQMQKMFVEGERSFIIKNKAEECALKDFVNLVAVCCLENVELKEYHISQDKIHTVIYVEEKIYSSTEALVTRFKTQSLPRDK